MYTSGGSFVPHEDGQSLTVLVNLSHADTFEGGGTAFWSPTAESDEDEGDCDCMPFGWGLDDDCDCMPIGWGRRPPTFSLSPPVGSALLFGGSVTHSGREVVCGERPSSKLAPNTTIHFSISLLYPFPPLFNLSIRKTCVKTHRSSDLPQSLKRSSQLPQSLKCMQDCAGF